MSEYDYYVSKEIAQWYFEQYVYRLYLYEERLRELEAQLINFQSVLGLRMSGIGLPTLDPMMMWPKYSQLLTEYYSLLYAYNQVSEYVRPKQSKVPAEKEVEEQEQNTPEEGGTENEGDFIARLIRGLHRLRRWLSET
ncbi:MAG: hypothetical protein KatS3mg045_0331 [Bellilinea sp.]|nr:MAG: hypothetical protein KatS3mg045_0331 [Bellilinea sp.]